jgi:hypothetical protein
MYAGTHESRVIFFSLLSLCAGGCAAAWVRRFGEPAAAAAAVRASPGARLGALRPWVEPLEGSCVVNLLGRCVLRL